MPIQSSTILKNAGPKQDLQYWMWNNIPPTNTAGNVVLAHPNLKDTYASIYNSISRIGKDGNIVWTKNSPSGLIYSADVDSSGNLYIISSGSIVAKINLAGETIWAKSISGSSDQGGIAIGASGAIYCVGKDPTDSTAIIYKLTSTGDVSWARKISGTSSHFTRVAVDESNNRVYAAGYAYITNSLGSTGLAVPLVAFDLNGTVQWQKRLWEDTVNRSLTYGLDVYGGDVYVSISMGVNWACPIFKYNSNGESGTFAGQIGLLGSDSYFPNAFMKINQTNGDIAIGYRSGSVSKYTNSGSNIWGRRLTTSFEVFAMGIDTTGDVYGLANKAGSGTTFFKIKGDGSGSGTYGGITYGGSATSAHYPGGGIQSWEASGSYSIVSATVNSTNTTYTGTTSRPVGVFIPMRTK